MEQANNVAHRLFSLIDTVSNSTKTSHESCEMQRKKLLADLASAQQLNHNLNQQLSDHECWNSSSQINPTAGKLDDFSRYTIILPVIFRITTSISNYFKKEPNDVAYSRFDRVEFSNFVEILLNQYALILKA